MRLLGWIQRSFSVLLLLAFAIGVACPPLGVPSWAPAPLLATVLFVACARITARDLDALHVADLLRFTAVRFVALPVALWGGLTAAGSPLAAPALLLSLLPTGVTSTAIASILRGNPAIALGSTLLSTAAAPVAIPAAMAALAGTQVRIDPIGMGSTLVLLLLVPTGLYFAVARRSVRAIAVLRAWGGVVSIVLICVIAFLVANGQRESILANPMGLARTFASGAAFYALVYGLGLTFARHDFRNRTAWVIASGNNNIVLGLTLALLHLPEHAVTFLAWDLAWITGLSAIQPVLRGLVPPET